MRNRRLLVIHALLFAAVSATERTATSSTQASPVTSTDSALFAVPTWVTPPGWTTTRGGDDGRIIEVTTLARSGRGSLAEALGAIGPRRITFAVGGIIDLDGRHLRVNSPHVTVAGETAPNPGITLIRGGIGISAHDVILRHVRVRVGEAGRAKRSGWNADGITTSAAHDVIVDHCSISWATDENLSASGPRFKGVTPEEWRKNTSHRITFSHCLIAEALQDSTHDKGPHSRGSLIHDNTSDIAIIGNLYISNSGRNPLFKGGSRGAIVNNLVHNPGSRVIAFGLAPTEWQGHEWLRGALVVAGNVARKGPSSSRELAFLEVRGPCDVYLHDNRFLGSKDEPLPATPQFRDAQGALSRTDANGFLRTLNQPPFWPPHLSARPAAETGAWVLANVGARPWDRDSVDRRLVEEARTGRGRIIDGEGEAGGYASLRHGAKPNK